MPRRLRALIGRHALALVILVGCGPSADRDYEPARAQLLRETVSGVILPSYRAVEASATTMHERSRALCDGSPDAAAVEAARAGWRELFLAWERTQAFQFGPTRDLNLGVELAFFPVRPTSIEANVEASTPLDEAGVEALGASGLGIFALEYLLFEPASAEELAAALVATPRRCTYLVATAAHARGLASRIALEWTSYGETMATAGAAGNTAFPTQASALVLLLTHMRGTVVSIQSVRLGTPLGDASAGRPRPLEVRARYAHISNEGMLASLDSVQGAWTAGAEGRGLGGYVALLDAALAAQVLTLMRNLRSALEAIPDPLEDYVVLPERTLATDAQQAARSLERTLGTTVATALSISVVFTDADGD